MDYEEHPPSPALARFVRCVWRYECAQAGSGPQRIVPDGCCELVVHYREPYAEDGRLQARAIFAGQLTRPLWLQAGGPAGVIGVRFLPAGARAFVGSPLDRFNDRRIAVDEIWPGCSATLVAAAIEAPEGSARRAVVEAFVAARIASHPNDDDAAVAAGVAAIESRGGRVSIEDLVANAGLGRRQLERRFRDAVGIGPALLASIVRFRSVFDLIEHEGARPWTEAALAAGYYDQSHFLRDFRRFVGCTPTQFMAERDGLAAALIAAG